MDLLCTPDDPAIPVERTLYVCKEDWDGGPFLTYAQRKGQLRLVPPRLRHGVSTTSETDEPYSEILYPAPRDEVEDLCQTWLFFGLLSEVLGLNESPTGDRLVNQVDAEREITALHRDSIVEKDGLRYLTGARVLEVAPLMWARARLAPDPKQRLQYLLECLEFTCKLLHSFQDPFNHAVKYSVAALGELLTFAIHVAQSLRSGGTPATIGYPWSRGYLSRGGELEKSMLLSKGWCISEVEKIRTLYQGLNTRHYLSRLQRPIPSDPSPGHKSCSHDSCRAFQLDPLTYRPAHAVEGCQCEHIEVDLQAVVGILVRTKTFPVIRVSLGDGDLKNLAIYVEEHREDVPYVALSHVWADGLGNLDGNSLPRCQIARIARLAMDLQLQAQSPDIPITGANAYRVWVDPLCCPVELETKKIALSRIADVYRNATHVLVLDKSISSFISEKKHPAELLLRAIGGSAWMRRLWTLQEGAFAQSIYFSFADRPLKSFQLFQQLFEEGLKDVRYMRIWHDISGELSNLHGFRAIRQQEGTSFTWAAPSLSSLQRSFYFRTVSVPSDEAICIATLMSLRLEYVTEVDGAEERMTRIWSLLHERYGGLPLRMIFFNDDPLSLPGWRWAPRTLLGAAKGDSMLSIDEKTLRFKWGERQPERNRDVLQQTGTLTLLGLKVKAPGGLLRAKPRLPGLPLHPWAGLIKANEDQIYLRATSSGKWFRVVDWYRSMKLKVWTDAERDAYDAEMNNALCGSIDTGHSALIYDVESTGDTESTVCRMVRVVKGPDESGSSNDTDSHYVHGKRTVILSTLGPSDTLVAEVLRDLATKAAEETVSHDLVIRDDIGDAERAEKLERLRELMQKLMAETWSARPDFVEAVRETVGPEMEEYFWAGIPKFCSHDIELVELGHDTTWIVD